ncbi:MAG TPA: malonyl-ACP O-methyltransferase BioC [Rudaea sp.]|nr:malonyl-ACP O-methyltransferase BioC [Rudaea sp.]
MSGLDRRHIVSAFGRAAAGYARHATLQRDVEDLLLERLEYVRETPSRVLDVGSGPGRGAAELRKRFSSAQVIALDIAMPMLAQIRPTWLRPIARACADARELPFADASIDVLYSSLCLQWIEDLPALFGEFRRVLRPGAYLAFSTFGPDSLYELRAAWSAVDDTPHVNGFLDIARVGDALVASGFRDPVLDVEHFTLAYDDAFGLMRDLKGIGATNADVRRMRGLTGKARLQRMIAAYESFRSDGKLPATYEVIFAHAWAPESSQPRRGEAGEIASFSVDQLRGSRRR